MKTKEDVQTIKPFFQKGFEIQYTSHCHVLYVYNMLDWVIKLAFQCPNMLIPQVLK